MIVEACLEIVIVEQCRGPIRILIAENHALTRMGIKAIIELRASLCVIGEACNGAIAVQLAGELEPDVIVMNVRMPVLNGIDAARQIHQQNQFIKIIMLTSLADESDLFASFAAGATGYCTKDIDVEDLYKAIYAIYAGDAWIDSRSAGASLSHWRREKNEQESVSLCTGESKVASPVPLSNKNRMKAENRSVISIPLSPREREVLALVVDNIIEVSSGAKGDKKYCHEVSLV